MKTHNISWQGWYSLSWYSHKNGRKACRSWRMLWLLGLIRRQWVISSDKQVNWNHCYKIYSSTWFIHVMSQKLYESSPSLPSFTQKDTTRSGLQPGSICTIHSSTATVTASQSTLKWYVIPFYFLSNSLTPHPIKGSVVYWPFSMWNGENPAVRLEALRLAQYGCDAGENTKPVRD